MPLMAFNATEILDGKDEKSLIVFIFHLQLEVLRLRFPCFPRAAGTLDRDGEPKFTIGAYYILYLQLVEPREGYLSSIFPILLHRYNTPPLVREIKSTLRV
jgi:hypothetical protein